MILFAVIPVAELYLLITIGREIGALPTIIIVILTGILGAHLARQQGYSVLTDIRTKTMKREIPQRELLHALFVLTGGILLLTPGFMTDIFGFSLLIPFIRNRYITVAISWLERRSFSTVSSFHGYRHGGDEHFTRPDNGSDKEYDVIDSDDVQNTDDSR